MPDSFNISKRAYSTRSSSTTLEKKLIILRLIRSKLFNSWVTGFSDRESLFSVAIRKDSKYKSGWTILPSFAIELKDKNLPLLQELQSFSGVGKIQHVEAKGHAVYVVNSVKDLQSVILPRFSDYPFLTVKRISFLLFKDIRSLMSNKKTFNKRRVKISN